MIFYEREMLKFKGKMFDCGSVDGFVKATNYFYDKGNK